MSLGATPATDAGSTNTGTESTGGAEPDAQPALTGTEGATPATDSAAPVLGSDLSEGGTEPGGNNADGTNPAPEQPQGPPESYADFTLPEGVEMNGPALEAFLPVAKDLGLSQEQAQRLIDLEVQRNQNAETEESAAMQQQQAAWNAELQADPVIGGNKWEGSLRLANRALNKFGDPSLTRDIQELGLGSHPGLVRMLVKMGATLSEDASTALGGQQPDSGNAEYGTDAWKQSAARAMFPTHFPKQ